MADAVARLRKLTGTEHWLGLTFVYAMAAVFLVDVPLFISRSGVLEMSLAEFVGAALWAWLVFLLVSRRWRPGAPQRALLWAVVAFCAWFVVVAAVRLLAGDEVLQAFLVLRSTLLPLSAFLVIGAGLETPARAMGGLVVFEVLLNLWHLGEWHNMRMSDFLGNSIVYAGLIVMLLPVNTYVASLDREQVPGLLRAAALLNMLAALVLPVWAGSRGVSAVAFVVILATFVIMIRKRRFVWTMVGVALVAALIQAVIWWVNPLGSAYGIYRLVPPPIELGLVPPLEGQASSDLAQRETALVEKDKSDAGRAELIAASTERIREDPLIGDGVVYFNLPDDGVVQEYAAHNFVLEHVNAYGAIGFGFYMMLFAVPLWPAVAWFRRRATPGAPPLLALLMTAGMLAFSLTQPTTLIMVIMVPYYAAVGALLGLGRSEPEGQQ